MTNEYQNQPQLPAGWAWASLGEICEPVQKVNPREKPDSEFKYIEIASISNQKITEISVCKGKDAPSRARQLVRKGDTVFSTVRTYLKNMALVTDDLDEQIASTGFCVLRPSKQINNKLIFYFVQTNNFLNTMSKIQRGTSYPAVRDSDVFSQRIALPPTAEQFRIVGKVEELFSFLDAGVASLRKVQGQLKRYRQAVLKAAFEGKLTQQWREKHKDIEPAEKILDKVKQELKKSNTKLESRSENGLLLGILPETWTWVTIGEIETFIGSGITPKGGRAVYVKEGVPFIRSQNVYPDGLHLEEIAHVTPEMHESMKRTKAYSNDVLLNITGASIGRSAVIPEMVQEANVNQHVCIIRTGWWMSPAYLSHFLNSPIGQTEIFGTQSGVTRQGLNYAQLRHLKIPMAPLAEQQEVVSQIEASYSLIKQVEKMLATNINYAEHLRQSILKDAFNGKLVPQDPADEPAERLLERIKAERLRNKSKNNQLELSKYVK